MAIAWLFVTGLAVSSLYSFLSHHKALEHCATSQAVLRNRLLLATQINSAELLSAETKDNEKATARLINTVGLISELLHTRRNEVDATCLDTLAKCRNEYALLNQSYSRLESRELASMRSSSGNMNLCKAERDAAQKNVERLVTEFDMKSAELTKISRETELLRDEVRRLKVLLESERKRKDVAERVSTHTTNTILPSDDFEIDEIFASKMLKDQIKAVTPKIQVIEHVVETNSYISRQKNVKGNPTKSDTLCESESFVFNTRRNSRISRKSTATSANRCKKLCTGDDECKGWTYVSDTSECLLHDVEGNLESSNCCVSGLLCRS